MTPEQSLIQAVGEVSASPSILAELTPSAQLSVGSYALGASEVVLSMIGQGADPSALAQGATSLVATLITDLVGGLFSSASSAVPIVGEILGSVIGILGTLQESQDAEEAKRAAEREAACKEEAQKWKTIGTGAWGAVLPADYFVQASRDYADRWTIHRTPFNGQFLRAVLATSWPRWYVATWRTNDSADVRRQMGHDAVQNGPVSGYWSSEIAKNVWQSLHDDETGRYANAHNWPPRPQELRIALKVLDGIAGQHPAVLALAGRPMGEAGREVWPLFCDLLYWLCRVPRPPWWGDGAPWTEESAKALGLVPVPTLHEPVIRRLYSSPADSPQIDSPSAIWVWWENMRTIQGLPELEARPDPIGWCHGYGSAGCNLLYGLADSWRNYAVPVTASDAETRATQVADAWAWMEQHLGENGPQARLPRRPISHQAASSAISAIGASLGWTEQAQQDAQQVVAQQAQPTTSTVRRVAIAGTLGLGAALAWALSG